MSLHKEAPDTFCPHCPQPLLGLFKNIVVSSEDELETLTLGELKALF